MDQPEKKPKPQKKASSPSVPTGKTVLIQRFILARRAWILARLQEADGPAYDALIKECKARTKQEGEKRWPRGISCVRALRELLWEGLATTEDDESVWLTPAGWKALEALKAAGRNGTGARPGKPAATPAVFRSAGQ